MVFLPALGKYFLTDFWILKNLASTTGMKPSQTHCSNTAPGAHSRRCEDRSQPESGVNFSTAEGKPMHKRKRHTVCGFHYVPLFEMRELVRIASVPAQACMRACCGSGNFGVISHAMLPGDMACRLTGRRHCANARIPLPSFRWHFRQGLPCRTQRQARHL